MIHDTYINIYKNLKKFILEFEFFCTIPGIERGEHTEPLLQIYMYYVLQLIIIFFV